MKKYYHGSFNDLHVGQILIPTKDYINNWENTDFYYWLEKYRPKEFLAHHESVFMCDNIDDLDNAGAYTDFIFLVKPNSRIEKHDMFWSTAISLALCDQKEENHIKALASNYWHGISSDEPVWEYLTTSAEIISVIE